MAERMLPRLIVVTDWGVGPGLLERLTPILAIGPSLAVQHRHPGALVRWHGRK